MYQKAPEVGRALALAVDHHRRHSNRPSRFVRHPMYTRTHHCPPTSNSRCTTCRSTRVCIRPISEIKDSQLDCIRTILSSNSPLTPLTLVQCTFGFSSVASEHSSTSLLSTLASTVLAPPGRGGDGRGPPRPPSFIYIHIITFILLFTKLEFLILSKFSRKDFYDLYWHLI